MRLSYWIAFLIFLMGFILGSWMENKISTSGLQITGDGQSLRCDEQTKKCIPVTTSELVTPRAYYNYH